MSPPTKLSTSTAVYIAIGAARALDAAGGIPEDGFSGLCSEEEFITEILESPAALEADRLGIERADRLFGIFAYEVAEEFGRRMALALIAGQPTDGHLLARELVDAITDPAAIAA
jgi:hypothetical protein